MKHARIAGLVGLAAAMMLTGAAGARAASGVAP